MIRLVLETVETEDSNFNFFDLYIDSSWITHYINVSNVSVIQCEQFNQKLLVSFDSYGVSHSVWVDELVNKTDININYEKRSI